MAIVVVGGSGKNVGKTTLVCGIVGALPEFEWIAVKISSHDHGLSAPIWEETKSGTATDTGRYLAAGARRAFLVTAGPEQLGIAVQRLFELLEPQEPDTPLIFESNRIVEHLTPDLCLAVEGSADCEPKPSFQLVMHQRSAAVRREPHDGLRAGARPTFLLEAFDRISLPMQAWLRARL